MTSPISVRCDSPSTADRRKSPDARGTTHNPWTADDRPPTPRGFTLVEMLVVISIIVLLAGFLLVAVNRVYRQGAKTRAAGDLAAIATALDAYKQDFGSYPPVTATNTGAAVLAKALIGPSPQPQTADWKQGQFRVGTATPPNPPPSYIALVDNPQGTPSGNPLPTDDWARIGPDDGTGLREFGFRVGPKTLDTDGDGVPDAPAGKVWGPYLPPEKFLTRADIGVLLDSAGSPILYFTASPAKLNVGVGTNYVAQGGGQWDANQNIRLFMRAGETTAVNALARIRAMLGDYDLDGRISSTNAVETAVNQPYLLWSAGADGVFGPNISTTPAPNEIYSPAGDSSRARHNLNAVQKSDDVTNFR